MYINGDEQMSNLSAFNNDGLEILINTDTGESFCSVSGYARMSGKDKSTISRRLGNVAIQLQKTAEIQTPKGLRTVAVVSEDLISEWIVDDNPTIAKQLLKAGVRVFLHKAAGYQIESSAVTPQSGITADTVISNAKAVAQFMKQAGIECAIADSLVLDAVANQFPELKGMTETGKRLLSAQAPMESVGLTPTEISERLRLSVRLHTRLGESVNAKTINSTLEALGLQEKGTRQSTKTGKDKHFWQLTEKGKQYGHVYITTGGNNWSGGQIRWQESVLRLIEAYLTEECDH